MERSQHKVGTQEQRGSVDWLSLPTEKKGDWPGLVDPINDRPTLKHYDMHDFTLLAS